MSASWFDGISFTCEIAFGDAPKAASPTYTDVSAYVRAPIIINRGTTSALSGISPGSMTLVLDNRDRRFDPAYSSGPYYGNLVPMTKVRLIATVGATAVTLFTGYVLGWSQNWTLGGDGTVEVTAVDGSRFVQNAELAASAYAHEVLTDDPFHYWPLQVADLALDVVGDLDLPLSPGTFADDTSGNLTLSPSTADITYPLGESNGMWTHTSGTAASTLPRTVEAWVHSVDTGSNMTFGVEMTNLSGDVRQFIVRPFGLTGDEDVSISFEDPANNERHSSGSATGVTLNPGRAHHLVATADGTTMYLYLDGQLAYSAALSAGTVAWVGSEPLTFLRSGLSGDSTNPDRLSHVAFYDANLSATRVQAHYLAGLTAYGHPYGERSGERLERVLDEIGWPSGQRDVDIGDTVQGPYLPNSQQFLDYARQVTDSEVGLIFFDVDGNIAFRGRQSLWTAAATAPTFSDDGAGGSIKYHVIRPAGNHVDNIRNIATTSYSTVGAITRKDQTSIDAYGEGRQFTDCPTIEDANTASTLSAYVLRENKDPKDYIAQIDCHMRLASGLNEFATLAAVELGDGAVVEHTPLGVGSQVVRTLLTTGISHMIDRDQWDVSLFCSAAPSQYDDAPYLTLGDADYGKIGATAGNLIPF